MTALGTDRASDLDVTCSRIPIVESGVWKEHGMEVGKTAGILGRATETGCEGLPGVYSTIWCLWYKTKKLKKKWKGERQAELNRPERRQLVAFGSYGVASGFAGGSSGRQPVTLANERR